MSSKLVEFGAGMPELKTKSESADSLKISNSNYESKIEELELKIQKFIDERNSLETKLEETLQDTGRKDFKDEIHVMASALSNEMEMMDAQLNRYKDAAGEAHSLREEADSLRALLDKKTVEHKTLSDKCAEELVEIKSLKALLENLEKEKQELQTYLEMYGQECFDTRTIMEIKESENRAWMQAEYLRTVLDEHSLELRVKAANEAEAACQQRLLVAEAEIADLRAKLDSSERSRQPLIVKSEKSTDDPNDYPLQATKRLMVLNSKLILFTRSGKRILDLPTAMLALEGRNSRFLENLTWKLHEEQRGSRL